MKTSNAAWGSSTLNFAYPIGFSIPLDDSGTASAEGRADPKDGATTATTKRAQVKGTCRLAGLCGRAGLPVTIGDSRRLYSARMESWVTQAGMNTAKGSTRVLRQRPRGFDSLPTNTPPRGAMSFLRLVTVAGAYTLATLGAQKPSRRSFGLLLPRCELPGMGFRGFTTRRSA